MTIERLLIEGAVHILVEHGRRGGMAKPEAVQGVQRDARVRGGLAHLDAELLLGPRLERGATRHLARFGAAKFEDAVSRRLPPEIVVERDAAMHLRAGDVERIGDQGFRVERHAAENLLQSVQDRERCALFILMLRDDFGRTPRRPWFLSRHAQPRLDEPRSCGKTPVESIKQPHGPIGIPDRMIVFW
jgi:hypothetical protein